MLWSSLQPHSSANMRSRATIPAASRALRARTKQWWKQDRHPGDCVTTRAGCSKEWDWTRPAPAPPSSSFRGGAASWIDSRHLRIVSSQGLGRLARGVACATGGPKANDDRHPYTTCGVGPGAYSGIQAGASMRRWRLAWLDAGPGVAGLPARPLTSARRLSRLRPVLPRSRFCMDSACSDRASGASSLRSNTHDSCRPRRQAEPTSIAQHPGHHHASRPQALALAACLAAAAAFAPAAAPRVSTRVASDAQGSFRYDNGARPRRRPARALDRTRAPS